MKLCVTEFLRKVTSFTHQKGCIDRVFSTSLDWIYYHKKTIQVLLCLNSKLCFEEKALFFNFVLLNLLNLNKYLRII
jgi:hypothetical protein